MSTATPMNPRIPRPSSIIYFISIGFVVILALTSAASGVNGFDEPIQFLGLISVLEHGAKVLQLQNPDFESIHSNLEYYGIAPRLPAYILWNLIGFIKRLLDPFGDLGFGTPEGSGLGAAYRSGYFPLSHLVSVTYLICTSLIVNRVSRKLGVPNPEFAGTMTLLFPAFLGFSLISVKDTAFAFFYSLYSFTLATVWHRTHGKTDPQEQQRAKCFSILHGFSAGILISATGSSLFVIAMSETIMAGIFLKRNQIFGRRLARKLLVFLGSMAITWFVLSPQSWSHPWQFLQKSIQYSLDGSQAWGGCMHFLNNCPRKGEDWNTLTYLNNWLFSTMPLLYILGLIFAAFVLIRECIKLLLGQKSIPPQRNGAAVSIPYLLTFMLQLSIIPGVMILRNGFIYDSIRHVLFLLPSLTILSYIGLSQAFSFCSGKSLKNALSQITFLLALPLLIDLILLHPFQYTYFNELALSRGIDWKNTDIDFYYASDAESLRNFMNTERFKKFAEEGGLDIKGSPPLEHAYITEHFPRKRGHEYFFTNHSREPGVRLRKDCTPAGKPVFRKQLFGPVNIYGTPQVCATSSYRDWNPF
jgi:hypothetical protein